jgi:hypothetical protein
MRLACVILLANGVYDLACALSILWNPSGWALHALSQLHLGMYSNAQEDPVFRRMLAYWIFTYGGVRVACGLHADARVGSLTYFLEALCLCYEHLAGGTLHAHSAAIVCGLCVSLGWYIMLQDRR